MLTSINHPEATLYEYYFGPKIPLPDDEEGTTWIDSEDEGEE